MSDYTDDTFSIIWRFKSVDGEDYTAVKNKRTELYQLYCLKDIEEQSYTNYVVKKNHTALTGTFNEVGSPCFISVANNSIHSSTGPAALVPHSLDGFRPRDIVEHHAIHGKLMSQHSWLTWVKGGPTWTDVMASFLGSKSSE